MQVFAGRETEAHLGAFFRMHAGLKTEFDGDGFIRPTLCPELGCADAQASAIGLNGAEVVLGRFLRGICHGFPSC